MPATGEVCDHVVEENYVFRFDEGVKEKVREWANSADGQSPAVLPGYVRNKVLSDLAEQKFEISVSRPRSRLSWGIPVPDDDS